MMNCKKRIEKLRKAMQENGVEAVVFGGADRFDANAYYYSGDTSFPSVCIVSQEKAAIFSTLQSDELPSFFDVFPSKQLKKNLFEFVEKLKPKKVGLDSRSDTLASFAFKQTAFEKTDFTKEFLEIREKKDEQEIAFIKKAQLITKQAVGRVLESDLRGLTESQVAGRIEAKAREMNASLDAFTPLVQSGERSAAWHNATTNAIVDFSKPLLIDVGAKYEFYCADYTTMFYEGSDKEVKDAITAVGESQQKAQQVAEKKKSGKKAGETALQVLRDYDIKNTLTLMLD